MNDSNLLENGEPGRRKKLPVVLIILAILLGVAIWLVRKAGEPAVSTETGSVSQPAKPIESAPSATRAAAPETVVSAEPRVVAPVKHKRKHKAVVSAMQPAPAVPEKTKVETPVAKPIEPAPKVAEIAPKGEASAPVVKTVPPSQPAKKFAMEDQPMPEKAVLSDETRLALNTLPKTEPKVEAAPTSLSSPLFKQGMEAYRKQDYAAAVRSLEQLPKPATKQRGDVARDEYVEGNFALGVSLLKSDRASDAVDAFNTVLEYEKYYPLANMNLGICYVDLKQYSKANKAFEAVTRDQSAIDPALFDDVMQRTKYFWALAWTRMYKSSKDADKQAYYQQQAVMRWRDYQTWFGKNEKYRSENRKAEDYIKSLSAM